MVKDENRATRLDHRESTDSLGENLQWNLIWPGCLYLVAREVMFAADESGISMLLQEITKVCFH